MLGSVFGVVLMFILFDNWLFFFVLRIFDFFILLRLFNLFVMGYVGWDEMLLVLFMIVLGMVDGIFVMV